MECTGPNSCRGQTKTLRNVANDFELVCGDISSCQNFTLSVEITANNPSGEVTFLKGITCGGENSCNGAQIVISNQQSNNETLFVEIVECGSIGSCTNAVFSTVGPVFIEEFICGSPSSCDGCLVNGINCSSV